MNGTNKSKTAEQGPQQLPIFDLEEEKSRRAFVAPRMMFSSAVLTGGKSEEKRFTSASEDTKP